MILAKRYISSIDILRAGLDRTEPGHSFGYHMANTAPRQGKQHIRAERRYAATRRYADTQIRQIRTHSIAI